MEKKPEQKEQTENVNKVLAFIDSNETTRKEIAISEFKGNKYLQVRQVWKKEKEDSKWFFCKKIVTFNKDDLYSMKIILEENNLTLDKIIDML